ncbi:MAG: hypothetical protein MSB10_03490 [Clostridiales bacterium]|uniref:hypothetical protein n=1 Tax=Flavonifractor porci TaxID=3133422 RepID=UPI0030ADA134|nr:hypothetical protein [Clostridiales bacterium]
MYTEHQEKVDRQVCANCGGTIKWNITKQRLECSACRTSHIAKTTVERVEEHDFEGYIQREGQRVSFPDTAIIVCGTCGAQIAVDEHCTATVCPMCGSTQLLESRQEAGVPPDGVIPFRVDQETAQQNFAKWVKSRWFAPNRLKQAYQAGKLQGIYLPFWTFDAQVSSTYWGQGGNTHTVRDSKGNTRTEIHWRPVSGTIGGFYDDLQVCATLNSVSQVVEKILPYNTCDNTLPFSSSYLSGFLAEHYAIPATQAVDTAKEQVRTDQINQAESDILSRGFDHARVSDIHIEYHKITYKHVLLPAWSSAFAYNGKQYMYIINGESGKVGGQRPYSIPKIVAAVAAAAAAITAAVILLTGASAPPTLQAEESTQPQGIVIQEDTPWMTWAYDL